MNNDQITEQRIVKKLLEYVSTINPDDLLKHGSVFTPAVPTRSINNPPLKLFALEIKLLRDDQPKIFTFEEEES